MINIYGIKTCGSVRKALAFFKSHDIEVNFFDLKKIDIEEKQLDSWLDSISIDKLFNNKGQKYRTLNLKDLNLDDKGKKEWLLKENMLFKRPIIEYEENKVLVAFDEETYKNTFL
jgi:Spx/MgsR family transcriptional regulator